MSKYGQKLAVDVANDGFLGEVNFAVRSPNWYVSILGFDFRHRARKLRETSGSVHGTALQRTDAAAAAGRIAVTAAAAVVSPAAAAAVVCAVIV